MIIFIVGVDPGRSLEQRIEDPMHCRIPYGASSELGVLDAETVASYREALLSSGYRLRATYAPNVKIHCDRPFIVGEVLSDLYRSSPNLRTITDRPWLVGPGFMPIDLGIWIGPHHLSFG
jgi:hypothetical protein